MGSTWNHIEFDITSSNSGESNFFGNMSTLPWLTSESTAAFLSINGESTSSKCAIRESETLGRSSRDKAVTLEQAECDHILSALKETGWIVGGPRGAADRLGVKRTMLLSKMRKHTSLAFAAGTNWPRKTHRTSSQAAAMKKAKSIMRVSSLCAMFATTITVKSYAAAPQSAYQLPSNAQVVEYLVRSANWYRHLYAERQVANEPGDLIFLDDNQTIEAQIVKLSFEFATADAAARTTRAFSRPYAAAVQSTTPPPNLAHFIELKNRSDEESQQAVQTISTLKQKIGIARNPDRKKLNAALDDAQRRLELLHAVSKTVNDLIESVGRVETGQTDDENLDSTINDLASSIPDLNNLAKLPAHDASSRTTDSWRNEGLLELRSEVSNLKLKLGVIDEKIRLTNDLAFSNRNLRIPLTGFISQVLRNSLISDVRTSDLASLSRQNTELGALTLQFKEFSPTILALDKQEALLAEYNSHVLSWRTAVVSQYRREWKKLVFRLIAITLIIGLIIGVGEFSRRLAFRRVRDPNRRRFIGIGHRVVTLLAICIVVLFGLALDLSSLATYFGLLTAGMAVALQSVILAVFSHFLLVGKYGIRIGDRVQISGITGDIIDMGLLQFQLREFDMQKQCFTGHVATFSNSLVFVSPAIGLLKFDSSPENLA